MSKKNIISIEFDDDDKDYLAFSEHLEEHTVRKKNHFAKQLIENGEEILTEISKKKKREEKLKIEYIEYIVKKDGHNYQVEDLEDEDFEEVRKIYFHVKEKYQPIFKKLLKFLFNF